MEKIKNDYPIATLEFKKLITGIYNELNNNSDNLSKNELVTKIHDEYISPGVYKIRKEYNMLMKSNIIKIGSTIASFVIPVVIEPKIEFYTSLKIFLTGAIASSLSHDIVDNFKELKSLKSEPYYVAWKMKFNDKIDTSNILNY
jgi:hypothetical protein